MYWIPDYSYFTKDKLNSARGYFTYVQNGTKSEAKNGIYKPRLTISVRHNCSRRCEETLAIELSLPKLFYGNNFEELRDDKFSDLIDLLQFKLKNMGVKVFTDILLNAPVSSVHYSKNIPLTDGTTPHYLINKIQQSYVSQSIDTDESNFRNEGYGYKWHTNSFELAFYDKIKDLKAANVSPKRAIETDNEIQLGLFDQPKLKQPFEVLRMEARLNNRQKIRGLLKSMDIRYELSDLTFKNLYSSNISKTVLLNYLQKIENGRPTLFDYRPPNSTTFLSDLMRQNPHINIHKAMEIVGIKNTIDNTNLRNVRAMFGKTSPRSWYRFMADTNKIDLPRMDNPLKIIHDSLTKFEPLKLSDYKQ